MTTDGGGAGGPFRRQAPRSSPNVARGCLGDNRSRPINTPADPLRRLAPNRRIVRFAKESRRLLVGQGVENQPVDIVGPGSILRTTI